MALKRLSIFVFIFILLIIFQNEGFSQNYVSPSDIDYLPGTTNLVICDQTGNQLLFFDTETEKIVSTIRLEKSPTGAICSGDGETIFVTAGIGSGSIYTIDAALKKIVAVFDVGFGLNSPVLSVAGDKLFVCSRFDNSVKIIDWKNKKLLKSIKVAREPVSASISADGKLLFVSNHLPDGRADLDYVASKISVIDIENQQLIKNIKLVNGAEGVRDICVSHDGNYVFAAHLMARYQIPTSQIERGWINTNALSVIQANSKRLLYTVLLDDIDLGFANPWALQTSADGNYLFVSAAGSNEIRIINIAAMTQKIEKNASSSSSVHLNAHNDLSFIADVSKRIKVKETGPRALLIVKNKLFVAGYFSESIGIIEFDSNFNVHSYKSVKLANKKLTPERLGEMVFNDATKCFQQWQSCASCHSSDGRVDALNWDLLNDGMGNPKNVKSLLYAHKTPPVMSLGVRDKAETAVRAGVKYIEFTVRPNEELEALDAYLKNLKPVPSPFLVNGALSENAKRGKHLFESKGCNHCHAAPLFTDLKSYDFSTGKGIDENKKFDTPTLIEVWRTAPYWHDGRAATISEAIKLHYKNSGYDFTLSPQELEDLSEYVKSL